MDRLSSHQATKEVVQKHNFKFSKSLGQNFLIDTNVIDRILEGARVKEGDYVIEVGPGIGTLTKEMGRSAEKVVAIEIDKTLIPILEETLEDFPNIEVINQDILKVNVQELVKEKLNLSNVTVLNTRIEEYAKINREKYSIVTARAVAPLKHLLEYGIPLVKVNGYFIAMKSNIEKEEYNINNYLTKLNIVEKDRIVFNLPFEDSLRTLVKYQKQKETDLKYPRKYNEILKKEI